MGSNDLLNVTKSKTFRTFISFDYRLSLHQRPSRFTNPFSTLHSNESCLVWFEFDVCSQRDVPRSVFNFLTFSICLTATRHSLPRSPTTLRTRPPASFDGLGWMVWVSFEQSDDHFEGRICSQVSRFHFVTTWRLMAKITCTHPRSFDVNNSVLRSTVNLSKKALDAVACLHECSRVEN